MVEVLAAYVVGVVQIAPNLIRTEYLNEDHQIVTVTEVIQETATQPSF